MHPPLSFLEDSPIKETWIHIIRRGKKIGTDNRNAQNSKKNSAIIGMFISRQYNWKHKQLSNEWVY